MKVGDLVQHRDDPSRRSGYGIVTKVSRAKYDAGMLVNVYWSGQERTICAYKPNELVVINESR